MRHRVTRVDTEVHQHLVQLSRIAGYLPQVRINREGDLDMFWQSVGEILMISLIRCVGCRA